MQRIAIALSILALVACGSSDNTQSGANAGGSPPVSAAAPASEAVELESAAVESEVVEMPSGELVTDTVGCVELVGAGRFGEAVTVCMEELEVDPNNPEVQMALAKAQAAQAGGEAAAAEAPGQATDAAKDATGSIPGGLTD